MERREGCRGSVTWREARIGELAGGGSEISSEEARPRGLEFWGRGFVGGLEFWGRGFVPSPLLESGSAIWDLAPLLRCKMRTHSHKHNVPKRILINLQIISVNFFPNLQRQIDTFSKNLM